MDIRDREKVKTPVLYTECDEIELAWKWEVCDVCDGKGTHVNPNVDRQGLTAEDFAEDPDLAEEYMRGTYDVSCNGCGGRTTIPVVDWEALDDTTKRAYEKQLEEEAADRQTAYMEARYFA